MSHILHSIRIIGRLPSENGLKLIPSALATSLKQTAQLHSVKIEGHPVRDYEPWPYKTRPYRWYHQIYEHTTKRMNENSKIVVVEGNIGTDKASLAKRIAEEFDMLYLPDVREEAIFINENGFDQRELNSRLGKDRFYELKDLYTAKNPEDALGYGRTQLKMFELRFFNYISALRHLLNTGQGVVVERSPWSDRCFADAMRKCGYFTREGKQYYNMLYAKPTQVVWMPHLTIYMDASVSQCKELIAKRNNPIEKNSPLLTDNYLQCMEDSYKERVLPHLSKFGALLQYELDDIEKFDETVAHDMQKVNLEPPILMDEFKFDDWYEDKEWKWNFKRQKVADDEFYHRNYFLDNPLPFRAPEICIQDFNNYDLVVNEHPSNRIPKGFDPEKDSVLFKAAGTGPYFTQVQPPTAS